MAGRLIWLLAALARHRRRKQENQLALARLLVFCVFASLTVSTSRYRERSEQKRNPISNSSSGDGGCYCCYLWVFSFVRFASLRLRFHGGVDGVLTGLFRSLRSLVARA